MQLMQSTVSTVELLQYQSALPTSSHRVNQHIYSDTTVTSLRIFILLFHTPPAPISSFFVLVFAKNTINISPQKKKTWLFVLAIR